MAGMLRTTLRRLPTVLKHTESGISRLSLPAHHVPRLPVPRARVRLSSSTSMESVSYDLAVVRGVAASLSARALRQSDSVVVDLQTALKQHSEYTRVSSMTRE